MSDRFDVNTQHEPYIRIQEIVLRAFREQKHHTPLKAFTINREVHFRLANQARDRVGRLLAPVEPWGRWNKELELDNGYGGMKSLTMAQTRPTGRSSGCEINVTVEPSYRIGDARLAIYVRVNDHYATGSGGAEGRAQLMGFLEDNFESSIRRGEGIIDHIMSLAKDTEEEG